MRQRWGAVAVLSVAIGCTLLLAAPTRAPRSAAEPAAAARWDLAAIGAGQAWTRGATGRGAVIAVVDSGIDLDHPELDGRVAAGTTCIGTGGSPTVCTADGDDVDGHGTHVAGIAASTAPDARLLAVRVLSPRCPGCRPTGTTEDVAAGIRWATEEGADVVNLSVATVDGSLAGPVVQRAVREAWTAGVVVVAAAGTPSSDGRRAQPVLVVTGTDRAGRLAPYARGIARSPWGLAAPGGAAGADPACQDRAGVRSTWIGGGHRCLSGTSMAAPHVAGAIAGLLSMGYDPAGAVDRLVGSARTIRDDGAAGVGAVDLATATGVAPVVDPRVGWPSPPGAGASGDPPPVLPPVIGGAVMGLCAAVAVLVVRDMRRAGRRRPRGPAPVPS